MTRAAVVEGACPRAAVYGAIHAVVDASCVLAVWRTGSSGAIDFMTSFAVVFGYDLLAFAGQGPLGALCDRLKASRAAVFAGLALAALSVVLVPVSPIATMICAGFGNALFHLGAGASVLRSSQFRAAPAGLFVAPGALGLGLGIWMGKTGTGSAWPFVALLALAPCLVEAIHVRESSAAPVVKPRSAVSAFSAALGLLLFSVAVRSFVGFGACRECAAGPMLLVGLPIAACAGKVCGGFLADRFGWIETSVAALLLCAPLVAFSGGSLAPALAGLFALQLTMPVTLVAVLRLMPDRPALAFGLPCVALVVGAVPTFFPEGRQLFAAATFVVLIVVSAISMAIALGLSGVPLKTTSRFWTRPNRVAAAEGGGR